MTERIWVTLAIAGGLDPWGEYWLRDLIIAARARMDGDFRRNKQLALMVNNLFSRKPQEWEVFRGS